MTHQRRTQPNTPAALVTLTRREKEVLQLAALGHDNRTIAKALVISYQTVRCHLARSYRKLGAKRRIVAISRAAEAGIIEISRNCKQN